MQGYPFPHDPMTPPGHVPHHSRLLRVRSGFSKHVFSLAQSESFADDVPILYDTRPLFPTVQMNDIVVPLLNLFLPSLEGFRLYHEIYAHPTDEVE